MRDESKDVWSKAVALTLLSTATKEQRVFHLIAFNGNLRREVSFKPGKTTLADLERALDGDCAGGTNFVLPLWPQHSSSKPHERFTPLTSCSSPTAKRAYPQKP
jgi:uncharacterized protein with von Willebrand factor type A (vWA) domain